MTIDEKFDKFHRDNPKIFDLLVRFALTAKNVGFNNYGIGAIFERIRWHINVETKESDGFKLSNNYRSRYARLLNNDPRLKDFFRLRPLRSK